MDIQAFKQAFDEHYYTELDTLVRVASELSTSPVIRDSLSHIGQIGRGGKRVRPYLVWGIACLNTDLSISDHIDLLLSVELLHLFCLIHDDVMDHGRMRHGVPTIHTLLQERYASLSEHTREALAILCGDIVFNASSTLMHRYVSRTGLERIAEVYQTLVNEVCVGQMLDVSLVGGVVDETLLYEKNRLKTAYYSFVRPIHLGVLVSGREELFPVLEQVSTRLGILFQLQDDMLDISYTEKTAKDYFRDISTGQPTHISLFMHNHATAQDRALFMSYVGRDIQPTEYSEIADLIRTSGALSFLQQAIETERQAIEHILTTGQLDAPYVGFIRSVVQYLMYRTS